MKRKNFQIAIILTLLLTSSFSIMAIGVSTNTNSIKDIGKNNNEIFTITSEDNPEYWGLFLVEEWGSFSSLKQILLDNGWKNDHIKSIDNETIDDEKLDDSFAWLQNNAGPSDTVLVGLSAHGNVGVNTIMSYSLLDNELDKIDCAGMLIIINSCYDGSAIPYLKQDGRVIITSSAADELSYGMNYVEGFHMITDIRKGNKNGVISEEELWNYVEDKTRKNTPQFQDDFEGDLYISNVSLNGFPDQFNYGSFSWWDYEDTINLTSKKLFRQSFRPTFSHITQVKIPFSEWFETSNLRDVTIKIYKQSGECYTTTAHYSDGPQRNHYITQFFQTYTLDNVAVVVPGETCYIVASIENGSDVLWFGEKNDVYKRGGASISYDNGKNWEVQSGCDFDFITYGYNVSSPPNVPLRPTGPTLISTGSSYSYSTSTSDAEGDQLYYKFDWDDGTDSGWLGPYNSGSTITKSHQWNEPGEYYIKVKAKDIHNVEYSWSSTLKVRNYNNPPDKPEIFSGLAAIVDQKFKIDTRTFEMDNDVLYLIADWDDGADSEWVGAYDSSENVSLTHTWHKTGTYKIKVKAKDKYGLEGEWGEFTISVIKSRSKMVNSPIINLLEKIQYSTATLERILSYFR